MDKEYILSNIKGRANSRFIKCKFPEEYDSGIMTWVWEKEKGT